MDRVIIPADTSFTKSKHFPIVGLHQMFEWTNHNMSYVNNEVLLNFRQDKWGV
jgi:hypothetical protein